MKTLFLVLFLSHDKKHKKLIFILSYFIKILTNKKNQLYKIESI